jgi:hypothetical protein
LRLIARDRSLFRAPVNERRSNLAPLEARVERQGGRSASKPLYEAVSGVRLLDVKPDVNGPPWERERDARYEKMIAASLSQWVPGNEEHVGVSHRLLQRLANFAVCSATGVVFVAERKPVGVRSENCTCPRVFGPPFCGRLAASCESRSTIPLRGPPSKVGIVGEHSDEDDVRPAPRPSRNRCTKREHCIVQVWRDNGDSPSGTDR